MRFLRNCIISKMYFKITLDSWIKYRSWVASLLKFKFKSKNKKSLYTANFYNTTFRHLS